MCVSLCVCDVCVSLCDCVCVMCVLACVIVCVCVSVCVCDFFLFNSPVTFSCCLVFIAFRSFDTSQTSSHYHVSI